MTYTLADDKYHDYRGTPDAPARRLKVVTFHDTNDMSPYAKALKCNAAGTIRVIAVGDYKDSPTPTAIDLVVNAGEYVPVQIARVLAAGTTVAAGSVIALI